LEAGIAVILRKKLSLSELAEKHLYIQRKHNLIYNTIACEIYRKDKKRSGKDDIMAGKKAVLVTNNPKALAVYKDDAMVGVDFLETGSYLDVYLRVRDRIHGGWHLLSHPQASNLKPMQCPFKTVLISEKIAVQDLTADIHLIESAIAGYEKLSRGMTPPVWAEKPMRDFMTVDLDVVESALKSTYLRQLMMNCR